MAGQSEARASWGRLVQSRLPWLLTALVMAALAASRLAIIDIPYEQEFDEGVYLLSARSVASGHALFQSVFSSQPPAFVETLTLFFRLFGDSQVTGRIVILVFSLLSLASTAGIARRVAGAVAGDAAAWAAPAAAAALALSLTFGDLAHVVQAESPAIALALLSLWICLEARERSWSAAWLLATGAVFGASLLYKLIGLPLAAPLAFLLLLAPPAEDPKWKLEGGAAIVAKRAFVRFALVAAGSLAIVCVPLLFFDFHKLYDQVIGFQLAKRKVYAHTPLLNLHRVGVQLVSNLPCVLLASSSLLLLVRRAWVAAFWGVLWMLVAVAAITAQAPLFWRHLVLVSPPLAVVAGLLPALVPAHGSIRTRLFAVALFIAAIAVPQYLGVGHHGALPSWHEQASERRQASTMMLRRAATWLQAHTTAQDFIAGDDPLVVYMAGREAPPDLCDTSQARIQAGALPLRHAIQAGWSARLFVLKRDGRLGHLAGFSDWLHENFYPLRPEQVPGIGGRTIWVPKPPE